MYPADGVAAGMLERGEELAELTAALGAALASDGRLVLVAGPAGIGKASLLEAFADGATAHEMTLLRARGTK